MSSTKRRSRYAIATICAFSLVAAACGDDDDASDRRGHRGADDRDHGGRGHAGDHRGRGDAGHHGRRDAGHHRRRDHRPPLPPRAPAAPTGTPIKIGLVYSETGRTALTYGMTDGVANAWAEWVNTEMGGVNGHPVEIVARRRSEHR